MVDKKHEDNISITERSITSHDDEYYDDAILQNDILPLLADCKLTVIRPHNIDKFIKIPPNNYYEIYNHLHQKVGYMQEDSPKMERIGWLQSRAFTIYVYDLHDQLLLKITRSRTFIKSAVKIHYNHPLRGWIYLGRSKYTGKPMNRHYELSIATNDDENNTDDHLFAKIPVGKSQGMYKPQDDVYNLFGSGHDKLASITRPWKGWKQEVFSTKNVYQLEFSNVSNLYKIIMLGTTISLDFDFFSLSG